MPKADGAEVEHDEALATVFLKQFTLVEIVLDDEEIFVSLQDKGKSVRHKFQQVILKESETDGKLYLVVSCKCKIE